MSRVLSDQFMKVYAGGVHMLEPNESGGGVRVAYFSKTVDANNPVAMGDVIAIAHLPKDARVLGGQVAFGALGGGKLSIGTYEVQDKYLKDQVVNAAGSAAIANSLALNIGDELAENAEIIVTVKDANLSPGLIKGYLLYVIS